MVASDGEGGRDGEESLEELVGQALNSREPVRKPEEERLTPAGFFTKLVLSKWAAPVFAALATASNSRHMDAPVFELSLSDKVTTLATTAIATYVSVRLFQQDAFLDRTEPAFRKLKSQASRIISLPFDYPGYIAVPVGIFLAEAAMRRATGIGFSEIPKQPALINSYANDLVSFAIPYITTTYALASIVFGRVVHPETRKAVKKAASALFKAYKKRFSEAAEDMEKLLDRPMGYRLAVNLQRAIGNMQMLSGNPAAVETYIAALATQSTHYMGRGDTFIYPFLSAITLVAKKAKKPAWAEATDISGITLAAQEVSSGKLEEADKILLLTVAENKESLPAHRARASFLRATRQHRTADLEMRVCGELVMQDPNAKMELIEGRNRNVVYFSGNIALKQFEDHKLAEGESLVVKRFRERFGTSVIHSLPVYKRSDLYYLLSERGPPTLLDLVKQRRARLEDFLSAMLLMVQAQKFGLELYNAKELQLNDSILRIQQSDKSTLYFTQRRLQAIENIEQFNGVKMPQSYKDALGYESDFIDLELANSEMLTMYKDSGPKNFLKRLFALVQVLDFEPQSLRLLPPQMDFINLTESVPYLNPKQLAWLQAIHFWLQQEANGRKLDRQRFTRTHLFSGLQWHDERLIYSTREAYQAKTPEEREERKIDQILHLVRVRECLGDILEMGYLTGQQLQAALRDKEELARPIFPDPEEQKRLEKAVEERRKNSLEQRIPPLVTRLVYSPAAQPR